MYNLQQIQAGQLCFHYSMSVSGQLLFLIFSALGALAQKRNQVMSNQSNLKGLQICKCENDVESSHDVDVLCRSFAGRKHHCFPWGTDAYWCWCRSKSKKLLQEGVLREKLLQTVRSESGFDMSWMTWAAFQQYHATLFHTDCRILYYVSSARRSVETCSTAWKNM